MNQEQIFRQVATDELLREVLKQNPNLSYVDLSGNLFVHQPYYLISKNFPTNMWYVHFTAVGITVPYFHIIKMYCSRQS